MLDQPFLEAVTSLRSPGMGTENATFLLYSLVRMTRPRSVLEVGLGYTTPFLLRALADNVTEWQADRDCLQSGRSLDPRRSLLAPAHFAVPYEPRLVAIDDFSGAGSTAVRVLETARTLGLNELLVPINGDFRGRSRDIDEHLKPFDFVWFDCGGAEEYAAFLNEYWSLTGAECIIALHFTYHWQTVTVREHGHELAEVGLAPGAVLAELRRQHLAAGADTRFELLSVVEPHKTRQGSVTLLRRHHDPRANIPEPLPASFRLSP